MKDTFKEIPNEYNAAHEFMLQKGAELGLEAISN